VISPLAAAFLQTWPEVRIELDLTNRMVDLVNEGVDLAIRIGDIHQTDVVAKYLCPYRMAICASPEYLARHGTPERPRIWWIICVCPIPCGRPATSGYCLA
jgi:DNA-binding transcriptional LysR family regulator